MASTTAQKLGIKDATTTLVSGRSAGFAGDLFGELPSDATVVDSGKVADIVVVFADAVADVARSTPEAAGRVSPGGRLWVAYRKGATRRPADALGAVPLHRDTLQAALAEIGMTGVTLISLDDEWSALRVKAAG